jgi:hypothetical protein
MSLSMILHAALVASAIAATRHPRTKTTSDGELYRAGVMERTTYVRPMAKPAAPRLRKAGRGTELQRLALLSVVPAPTVAPIVDFDVGTIVDAEIDPGAETAEWATRQFSHPTTPGDLITAALRRLFAAPTNGAYSEGDVEKVAWPNPNNPRPKYPSLLLSAGIEQSFVVAFIVDSTGRVDERSMDFPTSAHRLFIDSVKRALLRSRYFPAEVSGRRVAQHVIQQFIFRVER